MKVFISQPMNGVAEEEVLATRQGIFEAFTKLVKSDDPVELIDSYHKTNIPENAGRLWFLGNSISLMDQADIVIFAPGWSEAKGCALEFSVTCAYDKEGLKAVWVDGEWKFRKIDLLTNEGE